MRKKSACLSIKMKRYRGKNVLFIICRHVAKYIQHARELAKLREEEILPGYKTIDVAERFFHFLPSFPYFTHDECRQRQFLCVSCKVTMSNGHGTFIHLCLLDVEIQGRTGLYNVFFNYWGDKRFIGWAASLAIPRPNGSSMKTTNITKINNVVL